MAGFWVALFAAAFCGSNAFLFSSYPSRRYEFNSPIPVVVESVSPFDNPSERYEYDHLPWPCRPEHPSIQREEVGSDFTGERASESLFKIHFRRNTDKKYLCKEKTMEAADVNRFIDAIENHFEYEMRIDDLPVFGQVGLVQKDKEGGPTNYFLLVHRHFHLTYNDNRVITANISREVLSVQYVELKRDTPTKVHFSFEVQWSRTDVPYAKRWEVQLHAYPTRYQVEAHWLWIMNSSLLVVLLTGLFSMILLRTLKNDVARYLQLDQIDQEDAAASRADGLMEEMDESGWKRIRFDVFRPPTYPLLLSAVVGVGAQLLMMTIFLLFLAIVGYFYPGNHGRIYVACIFLYSLTAYVAGYVASAKMAELAKAESDWMWTTAVTASIFAGPFLTVFAVVNTVAIVYESTVALPFATILTCIILWAFITFPLTAFGSYRGAKVETEEYPCIVKRIPRPIPEDLPWYHNPVLQVLTAGFLPFMSIYVELGTIFLSVWGHQAYTLFGILALTFAILLIVTSFAVILLCYFQLGAEDYRWWWLSILRGGACGLFMYAYAWYYWVYQSHMSGALQGTMFFLYTFMISYAFSLMLGAVGHWASRWFVIKIYKAIKSD